MAQIIEINSLESLANYKLAWDALHAETPRASFFHTYDWLVAWYSHFGSGVDLRVLVAESDGKVLGIVPLVVRREQHHLGSERVLTFPLDDWGTWYGPIGRNQAATWALAARHLAQSPRNWDTIRLRWVDVDHSDRGRCAHSLRMAGFPTHQSAYQTSSMIDLASGWEHYLSQLDKKIRHEVRRTLRRFDDLPVVAYERHRPESIRLGDGEPRWDLFDQCSKIARSSWQSNATSGNTLCHDSFATFYRDTHQQAAKLGMLDLNLLSIDNRPVAYCYNYHFAGRVFGLRMGFDRESAPSGAGRALVLMMLRDSFARGDKSLEMGPGDQRYKSELRTSVETNYQLAHVPRFAWRSHAIALSQKINSWAQIKH
jgi:CelD/BcsL family acetyltransferase involved in cellulose biosynthesis